MSKTFDELFDDFFKRHNIKPEDKIEGPMKDDVMKIIDLLSTFNGSEDINPDEEELFDEALGKPDKIEFYNDGNLFFEKRIWYTDKGTLVKLIVNDDPMIPVEPLIKKSLEQQLTEAVDSEEFEKAAAIRDKINSKKK
jgi:hypothetical protein